MWVHRSLVDQLGTPFAQLFHEIRDCRFPLGVGPTMAAQFFDNWNTLTDLTIAGNQWAMKSQDEARKEFLAVVSRNAARARVRLSLE